MLALVGSHTGRAQNVNKGLAQITGDVDFSKWFVYFADERCVPLDSDDSNYKECKKELFDFVSVEFDWACWWSPELMRVSAQIPVPQEQIFTIDASLTPVEMAKDYTKKLAAVWEDKVRYRMIQIP